MRFVKAFLPAALIAASLAVGVPGAAIAGRDSCLEFPDNPRGGEVVITLTLRGPVSTSDEFWMALDTSPGGCFTDPARSVCAPADSPSRDFFGAKPCVAGRPYVMKAAGLPVGTVLAYTVSKGPHRIRELSGQVTVATQQQTRSLTYDYNLGLPNTAVRSEGSDRNPVLIIGILVAVPAGLVAFRGIEWIRGIRRQRTIPIADRANEAGPRQGQPVG